MDMLQQLNAAVAYIEAHLCDEMDWDAAAGTACVSKDSFVRFFSYMVGMTLTEYIRRRRLTLAACELRGGKARVMDIAVKYGWSSADAFTRAFIRQHGITPTQARNPEESLKIYPPASFCITIKGAREMDFRMMERRQAEVYGISKEYDTNRYKTREELRHSMWAEDCDDVPGRLCEGRWNQPSHSAYDGVWYGIWQDGRYTIARARADIREKALERQIIPSGTYAAFRTGRGGLAWEEFPRLFELIFDSWLPGSGYKQTGDLVVEVLHLWTNHDRRKKNRYYEVWLPIEKK